VGVDSGHAVQLSFDALIRDGLFRARRLTAGPENKKQGNDDKESFHLD
jgi:hypothetical protein